MAAQEPPEGAIDALLQKKLRGADPSDPRALKRAADALARAARAEVVQVIGTKFVLYRESHNKEKKDKIVLVKDKRRPE